MEDLICTVEEACRLTLVCHVVIAKECQLTSLSCHAGVADVSQDNPYIVMWHMHCSLHTQVCAIFGRNAGIILVLDSHTKSQQLITLCMQAAAVLLLTRGNNKGRW